MSVYTYGFRVVSFAMAVLVLGLAVAPLNADTIYVCWDGSGDYLTIQEGIDAASDGDEVVVCDGTYTGPGNKNLDFHGKAITVRSENGPDNCIIDCQGDGYGFHIRCDEGPDSVVDGLTVTNAWGGGFYCHYSSPTILNCVVSASVYGVVCEGWGSANIADCVFTENALGGGIYCFLFATPIIARCAITRNEQGIQLYYECSATISDSVIVGNAGPAYGGGMGVLDSGPVMVQNCAIADNTASWGGGCFIQESTVTIEHTIVFGNTAHQGPDEIFVDGGSLVVRWCDVAGGWPGEGNIDDDPLFEDPGNGDYHLSAGSPCIDAGDPIYVPDPDERDIDGQMRLWDGDGDGECVVDMGSDEFASIIPGDLNRNDCVDQPDLGILLAAWCTSDEGDLDCDGDTDHSDLGILLAHWGEGCP